MFRNYFFAAELSFIEVTSGRVNSSIKIPPPVGEIRFPVLAGVRRVATSLSRILKRGFGAAGCGLKERRRRVSLNDFAVFVLFGGLV